MKKRQRTKRVREKVRTLPLRRSHARIHYIKPDPDHPHRIRVYISPNPKHMHTTIKHIEGGDIEPANVAGMVRHYYCSITGRYVVRPRQVIGSMYLNMQDIRANGTEIMSHECVHAGMIWARMRKANLAKMEGEEVMAYAVGRMTSQITKICNRYIHPTH